MLIKRIKPDNYLKKFIEFCKNRYKDNLIAIVIYGSYVRGYFNKRKSDYDVFIIFKDKTPKGKKEINKKYPKISLQYFCTTEELSKKIYQGHWSVYITLLKDAKILYYTKRYKKFLKQIKNTDFIERLLDTLAMQYKAKFEIETLKKIKGYAAAKWALPSIRKRLQLLTYLRKRKLTWNLRKVIRINKDLINKDERKFILKLDKIVRKRKNSFSKKDKQISIQILNKLNNQIIFKELSNP